MKRLLNWLGQHDSSFLTQQQRSTHTYVIGQPGTGKSRALEAWMLQDIVSGQGLGLIDPHGDLFQRVLARLANMPQTWRRVVILDPHDPMWTVGFNPLEAVAGLPPERLALFLTDVVIKIWGLDTTHSPRMIWLLTNTFLALASLRLSLLALPRFLTDTAFREGLLTRLPDHTARLYFTTEFPTTPGAIHQWVTPVLNKIGGLLFDPDLRLLLAGSTKFSFREILDRRLILLVNLPKGILGEGASALMGAFIVAHLQKAALARADTSSRAPFYLYLDEFQNYTTDNIKDILSESRKYALSLVLAHQYLDQLAPDMRSAVLNTAGTLASFRVGYQDATRLAKEIFPSPDYLASSNVEIGIRQVKGLPFPTFREHRASLGWDSLAQNLAQLRQREFWSRQRRSLKPVKQRTFGMPDPAYTPEIRARIRRLRAMSASLYGRSKQDALREINRRYRPGGTQYSRSEQGHTNDGSSLWSD